MTTRLTDFLGGVVSPLPEQDWGDLRPNVQHAAWLDTVSDDEGAAGGSSFRGLLPAGATAPLAEDDKR